MKNYTIAYFVSMAVALLLTPLVTRVARVLGLVDIPNARKVHRIPVPRVGGIAIFIAFATSISVLVALGSFDSAGRDLVAILVGSIAILAVGFADDIWNISAKWKLVALLAASLACWACGVNIGVIGVGSLRIELGWFDMPLTVLWIVGVTVAVNFMDGLDGLAAGICAITVGAIAIMALMTGHIAIGLAALALLGSLSGFLVFNFNPASVFMGDSGSLFVGFSVAALSVIGHAQSGMLSGLALPAAALAIPILDATSTMIRRGVLQRRSLFSAERGHIHHKLIDLGLSHRHAVIVLHSVTLISAGLAGWMLSTNSIATGIALGALLALTLYALFHFTGSVRVREMMAAVRRNRDLGQRKRTYQDVFEEMQVRFAFVDNFDAWWEQSRSAAEMFEFQRLSLRLTNRDGSTRVLTWTIEEEGIELPTDSEPVTANHSSNGNGNGQAVTNGNGSGNGNGHVHTNGHTNGVDHGANGNGPTNGIGKNRLHRGASKDIDYLGDKTFNASVPIRERRAGGIAHAEVEVRVKDSLESAATRVALMARLLDEYSLASLPESSRTPSVGLSSVPGSCDVPSPADLPARPAGRMRALPPELKVAIVHDFLYTYAGAERVLEQILNVFPDADLFSMFDFVDPEHRGFLRGKKPRTSFIQKLPWASSKHRTYLPLMPLAVEQLDVTAYDLVISSSYVVAKGVITRPDQLHICYCHSPVRFAWDLQHQYLSEAGLTSGIKSFFARSVLHYLRNWDARSAAGVDLFVTNSDFVGRRIKKFYRRPSTTIYPPVAVEKFEISGKREDFYLTVSRMVPYKRIGLIVDAFTAMPDKRLIVVGEGPEFDRIKARAGPNVRLMGYQPFERVKAYMQMARAFIFAAEEDFGIVPVEAQACGTPVIAFGRGGVTESVLNGRTGIFFSDQTPESLITAVHEFEGVADWDPRRIRENAERFSADRFREKFLTLVEKAWKAFRTNNPSDGETELLIGSDMLRMSRRLKARVRQAERRDELRRSEKLEQNTHFNPKTESEEAPPLVPEE